MNSAIFYMSKQIGILFINKYITRYFIKWHYSNKSLIAIGASIQ